jgi:hypothetical protein
MSGAVPVTNPITGTASEFCAGSPVVLTETATGGAWSSSNGRASVTPGGIVTGISGGVDTIMYSIVNGCGSAMSVYTVTIDPLPAVSTILGTTQGCAGFTITVADEVSGGTWSSSNNAIATVNSGGIVRCVSPGMAFIIYTTFNSCGNTLAEFPFTVLPLSDCITGVAAPGGYTGGAEVLSIFPDPNAGAFTVKVSSVNNEPATIVITNMVGQKVKELTGTTNTNIAVRLSQPAGVYFISATTAAGVVSGKVVLSE